METCKILGLDLGPNSIGWALIEKNVERPEGKIIAAGSRILPMNQRMLSDFEKGVTVSQTAERRLYRSMRRLKERHRLRRQRLLRVLHILGFLPSYFDEKFDFCKYGRLIDESEPKLPFAPLGNGKYEFAFTDSFNEMLSEFAEKYPEKVSGGKKVPYNWTLFYLRKKALSQKIKKEELAWILLNFNHKRGYYQLRGEVEKEEKGKKEEYYPLLVKEVRVGEVNRKGEQWYEVVLENGWVYRRTSKTPLNDWEGTVRDFIVTTFYDEKGNIKTDKDGREKRSFRAPGENDWTLIKKKTESDIEKSNLTVGAYIYDHILENPSVKIKGKLVATIERDHYRKELNAILKEQMKYHPELRDASLYKQCILQLYPNNEEHRKRILGKDISYLLENDIIFYHRPLKIKNSQLDDCPYETRYYVNKAGEKVRVPVKCIARSHPLFQEFRLWQFIQNLRIYARESEVEGNLIKEADVTSDFLKTAEDYAGLFSWLNEKKEIDQKGFFKYPAFKLKQGEKRYKWNFIENKAYPCNETRAGILLALQKAGIERSFLTAEIEISLWHLLYSVEDRREIEKALKKFAAKYDLPAAFVDTFSKISPYKKEYGAYSEKAIRKLLPLMRMGSYWDKKNIGFEVEERILKIINGEYDPGVSDRAREKVCEKTSIDDFNGMPLWQACYVVYNRHSESGDIRYWKTPEDIRSYLRDEFRQYSLRNPIVEQVITETLRVVAEIWDYYGNGRPGFFDEIHLEMGREMKQTKDERSRESQRNIENENTNRRIRALLLSLSEDIKGIRPYSPSQQEILRIYETDVLCTQKDIPEDIEKISRSSNPSRSELLRYKLWLEQKYRSPYTGEMIPLSRLFTPEYQIEHIIPKKRYFDDSYNNKVICESYVNRQKDNMLAYEYINKGSLDIPLLSPGQYVAYVRENYKNNPVKMKNLLMEDVPQNFTQRQMNDSRYIARIVKSLLSNVIREEDEQEDKSKHMVVCDGKHTARLRRSWGLDDVWNDLIYHRFERLNEITHSENYGYWTQKEGKRYFLTSVPSDVNYTVQKKRLDHRHHILDAILIAVMTVNHINYLSNRHANENDPKDKDKKGPYIMRNILCEKKWDTSHSNYEWIFKKPWPTFTQEVKEILSRSLVSFKQNLRIINKTNNRYRKWSIDENGIRKKVSVLQSSENHWAVRKPLHKETFYGKVTLKKKKQTSLSNAVKDWEMIADKDLKRYIGSLIAKYGTHKEIMKFFKGNDYKYKGKDIAKVEIYYSDSDIIASRTALGPDFTRKKILSVTDTGIQKILLRHLSKYDECEGDNIKENPGMAFSPEGIMTMNRNISELNNGKFHHPIYKVRCSEPLGCKFVVGSEGNKKTKYVEAASGTNLFYAVYTDEEGNRQYESVPLNVVVERCRQGEKVYDKSKYFTDKNGSKKWNLLFGLSPGDLVYVPTEEELATGHIDWSDIKSLFPRIYKMVSCTDKDSFYVPHTVAIPIVDKIEFEKMNKIGRDIYSGKMIKQVCYKIKTDRLGNIIAVNDKNISHD